MDGVGEDSSNISIGEINDAPIETPPIEKKRSGENPLTGQPDPNLPHHLGWLGKFAGGGPEKAGNIALVVVCISLLLLIVSSVATIFVSEKEFIPVLDKIITGTISLITGALGYLFGSSKNGNS